MKVWPSMSKVILRLKRLHLSKHFQRKIRNTSNLYSNRSTANPYRTTTAWSQSPMRRKVTVGTTKLPSSDNSPSNQYLCWKCFPKRMQLLLNLCWKAASQKLSFKGQKSRFTQGQTKNHSSWGNLLCGKSWFRGYRLGCVSCVHGTWKQVQGRM